MMSANLPPWCRKYAKRRPTIKQASWSQNPAGDDRQSARKMKTDPQQQDDAPRLPKDSKRRSSMQPGSDPVTKKAKTQHPHRSFTSQLTAVDEKKNKLLKSYIS
jgi:hypothetical protein